MMQEKTVVRILYLYPSSMYPVSCILYLYPASFILSFHRFYEAEVAVSPAIYNIYISAATIGKDKKILV